MRAGRKARFAGFGDRCGLVTSALVLAVALVAIGCDGAHAQERRVVSLTDLPCAQTSEAGTWQSSVWHTLDATADGGCDTMGCPWVAYPAKTTVQFEHPLGRVPASVLVYLAFGRAACGAALSAGDTARIQQVTDRFVAIRNDSRQDFFVQVVLQ